MRKPLGVSKGHFISTKGSSSSLEQPPEGREDSELSWMASLSSEAVPPLALLVTGNNAVLLVF